MGNPWRAIIYDSQYVTASTDGSATRYSDSATRKYGIMSWMREVSVSVSVRYILPVA